MLRINPTQLSHLSCEVKDYPTSSHPKIRPFILYVFTLSEPRNNLYLPSKLTERQGRKFTNLREAMAASGTAARMFDRVPKLLTSCGV